MTKPFTAFIDILLPFMRKKLEELGEEIPELSMDPETAGMPVEEVAAAVEDEAGSPVVEEAKDALTQLMEAEGMDPASVAQATDEAFTPDDSLAADAAEAGMEEDEFAIALEESAEADPEEALESTEETSAEDGDALAAEAAEMADMGEEVAEAAGDMDADPLVEPEVTQEATDDEPAMGDETKEPSETPLAAEAEEVAEDLDLTAGLEDDEEEDEDGIPKKKKKDPLKSWSDAMLSGSLLAPQTGLCWRV